MQLSVFRSLCFTLALCIVSYAANALTFQLPPPGDDIVGQIQKVPVQPGDTFHSLGQRYDVGYYEMVEANYGINPNKALTNWSTVIAPTVFILPDAPRKGIVINLAELRLYYYPPGKNIVMTYPVGIGREGWDTPVGEMHVINKRINPTWTVPESVREDSLKHGKPLPEIVPSGPENPLGYRAMRLSKPSYLIHGTNTPEGVGMRSSAGCMRMFEQDVEELYPLIPVGTKVRIVDQPFKAGWVGRFVYLEAHQPLDETNREFGLNLTPMVQVIMKEIRNRDASIEWNRAISVAEKQTGLPSPVGGISVQAWRSQAKIRYGQNAVARTRISLSDDFSNQMRAIDNMTNTHPAIS